MAGLIVKSSYYKCGGNATLSGYLRYIATRPRAERLGYDNAKAWRDLLRAHRNDIAAAINIPPNDFRWYAAFHDEGDHSHVHMMAESGRSSPSSPMIFLSRNCCASTNRSLYPATNWYTRPGKLCWSWCR